MSRSVETCIRGCQNDSFSSTQDVLNILTVSVLEHEQDGEPLHLRKEETCSRECLTDGVISVTRRAGWEHCSPQKCMSSKTQSSAQVQKWS